MTYPDESTNTSCSSANFEIFNSDPPRSHFCLFRYIVIAFKMKYPDFRDEAEFNICNHP